MQDDPKHRKAPHRPKDKVKFSDFSPYLLLSDDSVEALNEQCTSHIDVRRFRYVVHTFAAVVLLLRGIFALFACRGNIIISGGKPFVEDTLRKFRIRNVQFHFVRQCGKSKPLSYANEQNGHCGGGDGDLCDRSVCLHDCQPRHR